MVGVRAVLLAHVVCCCQGFGVFGVVAGGGLSRTQILSRCRQEELLRVSLLHQGAAQARRGTRPPPVFTSACAAAGGAARSGREKHGAPPQTPALSRRGRGQAHRQCGEGTGSRDGPLLDRTPKGVPGTWGPAFDRAQKWPTWRQEPSPQNPGAAKLPDRGGGHPAQPGVCWWRLFAIGSARTPARVALLPARYSPHTSRSRGEQRSIGDGSGQADSRGSLVRHCHWRRAPCRMQLRRAGGEDLRSP